MSWLQRWRRARRRRRLDRAFEAGVRAAILTVNEARHLRSVS